MRASLLDWAMEKRRKFRDSRVGARPTLRRDDGDEGFKIIAVVKKRTVIFYHVGFDGVAF